ncbi:MAG TPA: aminotransferase class III-fold pyridoxal phosphate-dependent enzyme [Phototrophicaceae bacterium]|nr:aminotransferase class III-fold pyridoxal phosphate-dependent enzyme [Phototrophicaceae bacterium]
MVSTITQQNKEFTLVSWGAQGVWNPIPIVKGDGVYIWDADGKRYLDWASQLVNVNIGHSHPHVVKAIQDQAAQLCYVNPSFATEPRGRLGEMLADVAPGKLTKTFFTNGGADGIENAMKIARLYTGRQKILTRYKSYHGGTFAAASAGGDPRRIGNEPGVPWIVRLPDPYAYRSPLYRGHTQEEGDQMMLEMVEDIILSEGPKECAAILIEGYSGTSGIIQPSATFFSGIRQLCDKYGMLLIVDEVMSGFGRTGEWFGIDHYPDATPDIMVFAKGVTCGYVPLGGAMVTDEIAAFFDDHVLQAGLTYSAHTLACAAGVATLEVYQQENLIERSRDLGKVLRRGLMDLAERHPVIGDIRGTGLHQVIELVKNRDTREPMSDFNKGPSEPMGKAAKSLRDDGMNVFVRWNMIFNTPPLVITEDQLQDGLSALDRALDLVDPYYEG